MGGQYGTLKGGTGNLGAERFRTLDAKRAAEAEARADMYLDEMFRDWDRSAWSEGVIGNTMRVIWTNKAEGEYILLDLMAANPNMSEEQAAGPALLFSKARELTDSILARGFFINDEGEEERHQNPDKIGGNVTVPLSGHRFRRQWVNTFRTRPQ